MATRFLRYDSDPILRKKCKAVLKVDDKIRQLLDDMLDTLHETENGAALAANQVGVLKRLVVIDFNDTRAIERSKLDRETNIELVETMWKQFSNLGIYELNVIDTTTHSIKDTVSAVKEKIVSGTALLF